MTQQERPPRSEHDTESARALAVQLARACQEAKCEDVQVIDVRELSQITNYLVLATGTSDRQMRTAADDCEEIAEETGHRLFGRSLDPAATWIVLDFVDVVAHVFEPNTRTYYDMETLWGEGPRVEWNGGGRASRR